MKYEVETYTFENGSNVVCISYDLDWKNAFNDIANDLRENYTNWDYAIVSENNGDNHFIIER